MPFYTSEQILNQALDEATGTLKTSGPSGAAAATAANQTTTNDRLGTPGTGEPAHAGGSTGLIGWARDILANGASILAKIAAAGTSGVPSPDVMSVQGPPNQFASVTFTGNNQELILNCEGMSSAVFVCRLAGVLSVSYHLDYGNGIWADIEYFRHSSSSTAGAIGFGAHTPVLAYWYLVSTRGAKRVRLSTTAWTSGGVFDAVVNTDSPVVQAEIVNTIAAVGAVTTPSNCSEYYTDTATPLAANALFIGSTRAMLAGNNKFNSLAVSDLGSTTNGFFTQGSTDVGTTWRNHKLLTMPASDPTPSEVQRTVNSYRIGFQNGASAQTFFSLTSSQTPN